MATQKIVQIAVSSTSVSDSDNVSYAYDTLFALLENGQVVYTTPRQGFSTKWWIVDAPDPGLNIFEANGSDLVGE